MSDRKINAAIKDVFESMFYLRSLLKKRQMPTHWDFEHQENYIKSDEYRKYKMAINTIYNFSPTLYKFLFKIGWLR